MLLLLSFSSFLSQSSSDTYCLPDSSTLNCFGIPYAFSAKLLDKIKSTSSSALIRDWIKSFGTYHPLVLGIGSWQGTWPITVSLETLLSAVGTSLSCWLGIKKGESFCQSYWDWQCCLKVWAAEGTKEWLVIVLSLSQTVTKATTFLLYLSYVWSNKFSSFLKRNLVFLYFNQELSYIYMSATSYC